MKLEYLENILLAFGGLLGMAFVAFFTGSEIALISSDKLHLKRLRNKGIKEASAALKLQENIDQLLTTTQFGANLSIALATTLITLLIKRTFHDYEHVILLLFTPLVLIFSDILPKVVARHRADRISLVVAVPLLLFSQLIKPIIIAVSSYIKALSSSFGLDQQDSLSRRKRLREEVHALLTEGEESEIRQGQKRLIKKILDFSKHNVRKVLLPLVSVDAIEKNISMAEAIVHFEKLRHSRLPVYDDRVDNIVGILEVKDVFFCTDLSASVSQFMRPALFVTEFQQMAALTSDMKAGGSPMAVVVDEYGGAVGILTKEDVLEELVGDISDEFDDDTLSFLEISANTYLVNTSIAINDLNERLESKIPKGDYETLSGFLLQQFNRIPTAGDELYFSHLRFRVHRATEKAIQTVIITLQDKTTENQSLHKENI
jgi:putative hemolysin